MTSSEEIERRRALIDELSAIWDVEGLETSQNYKELEQKYVSGEITLDEFRDELFPKYRFNV